MTLEACIIENTAAVRELVELFKKFEFRGTVPPAPIADAPAPKTEPAASTPPKADKPAKAPSYADVAALVTKVIAANGRASAVEILGRFKLDSLKSATPEQYPVIAAACNEALAG